MDRRNFIKGSIALCVVTTCGVSAAQGSNLYFDAANCAKFIEALKDKKCSIKPDHIIAGDTGLRLHDWQIHDLEDRRV